jgi:hypothetical protein
MSEKIEQYVGKIYPDREKDQGNLKEGPAIP